MNVAYILSATIRSGGATKSFLQMLSGLMREGVSPVVIVPDQNGICKDLKEMGIPVYSTPFRMRTYPNGRTLSEKLLYLPRLVTRLITNRTAIRTTVSILRKHAIDIVHTNVGPVDIGFRAAQKLGIPHVFHLREYGELDFGLKYFPNKRHFYRQLDEAPRSYSISITRDIQRYHHQDGKENSRVIYNGICPAKKEMPVLNGEHDYFLYAGRIEPAKGVMPLLEAYLLYSRQASKPLPLQLAGHLNDGIYAKDLQHFIATNGLQELVSFLGDRNDITDLMRKARAIIIPSLHEGFGRCMPEAMMQGCLAIGHNTSGTKEQFDNGLELTGEEIGLRYNTCEELASLLLETGTCPPEKYQPYRERAFQVVNKLYTQENNVQKIKQFYQDILANE